MKIEEAIRYFERELEECEESEAWVATDPVDEELLGAGVMSGKRSCWRSVRCGWHKSTGRVRSSPSRPSTIYLCAWHPTHLLR